MLQDLYYSLDKKDRYYRFFSPIVDFRHKKIQPYVNIDYLTDMIIVVIHEENGEAKIVGIGGLFKTHLPSNGEIAFTVHKDWRGFGISKFLLHILVVIGRELNYHLFTGAILLENKPMLNIIHNSGYPLIDTKIEKGVANITMDITKKRKK